MNEIQLLTIGALIGLASSIIIQLVAHTLSVRRDKSNWQRDEVRREKEYLKQESERLEIKKSELESELTNLQEDNLVLLNIAIILLNQRRDTLLGFDHDEQQRRANIMREILKKLNKDELKAIAEEKKPLPELPGKPKSLSN